MFGFRARQTRVDKRTAPTKVGAVSVYRASVRIVYAYFCKKPFIHISSTRNPRKRTLALHRSKIRTVYSMRTDVLHRASVVIKRRAATLETQVTVPWVTPGTQVLSDVQEPSGQSIDSRMAANQKAAPRGRPFAFAEDSKRIAAATSDVAAA